MSNLKYYTVTLDYTEPKNGWHTRAIMIVQGSNENDAIGQFGIIHGHYYADHAKVTEGIRIEDGFHDLITEGTQKIIVKVRGKSQNAPTAFSYSNAISVKPSEQAA